VEGSPNYPYDGIPVSFKNVSPRHVSLESFHAYTALPY
jgi:hypothetical protein